MKFKLIPLIVIILQTLLFSQYSTDLFDELPKMKSFTANRVSSYDTTGGNLDRISIASGEAVEIADINGPGIITHIWITVAAEPFYSGKIVWRMYWDGEKHPSVEAPLGDFFGVGHGIDRNYASLPFTVTANGKARNCFFPMPFRKSAKIEVTNEGRRAVTAFYYYIDYQVHEKLNDDVAYFHAHYRQEMPCTPHQNYLFLNAAGAGHYVGVNLSIMNTKPGWWGEGDDMIYVDGETHPSFHGTGSEDYFCDAWGMRESHSLFYGCPIQERDFGIGAKATVYRFHIPDPIPFKKSIRVTIEHGHDNDRADLFSSVAYWYQQEPHAPFPPLPTVSERLPYAVELSQYSSDFSSWKCIATTAGDDCSADSGLYYYHDGARAKFGILDFDQEDDFAIFRFPVPYSEKYDVSLSVVTGNDFGRTRIELEDETVEYDGYSEANH
ncbi:DUF2961 domain-containing protein, partial [candidate division KSB1 bacterium]|nr:DUF2961 domain-containing protein [candidate division KSB1 bacterium]